MDRGERARVRDMVAYGHWKTRLALAGRSKAVRLFMPDEETTDRCSSARNAT
ncbi:hypothetical protein [Streptomyces sp. 7N604]|uniref:hypothetical protein n=1 Tax=Streptomyces sp. 7N604 TaxID=3457415 RepID=UPI003FCF57AF